jgi:hypothetical protein
MMVDAHHICANNGLDAPDLWGRKELNEEIKTLTTKGRLGGRNKKKEREQRKRKEKEKKKRKKRSGIITNGR